MDNEKIENLLNLSLNSTREERERSSVLETGYSSQEDTWEVIIKFSGEFQKRYGLLPSEMRKQINEKGQKNAID